MHLVNDDTSSLLGLRNADSYLSRQSIVSDSSSILDVNFEFDREIFNSKAYEAAMKSALGRRKRKMSQRQRPPSNDAINIVGYERFNDTEDDAQTILSKSVDSWRLNDTISYEAIKQSNQADDTIPLIRKKKGKVPRRQGPPLIDATNALGYERFNDTEDDAQTIRSVSVSHRSWVDTIEHVHDKRPSSPIPSLAGMAAIKINLKVQDQLIGWSGDRQSRGRRR